MLGADAKTQACHYNHWRTIIAVLGATLCSSRAPLRTVREERRALADPSAAPSALATLPRSVRRIDHKLLSISRSQRDVHRRNPRFGGEALLGARVALLVLRPMRDAATGLCVLVTLL